MTEQDRLNAAYADMSARHGAGYHSLENPAVRWMEDQKRRSVVQHLLRNNLGDLAGLRILEIGCGSGGMLPYVAELGADPALLHGIDLQEGRIAAAQAQYPDMHFQVADATQIPFEDASFQIVLAFTVFSSILDPILRRQVASEIQRVLTRPGLLLWYDMRWHNPRNPHIRPVSRSELGRLFPGSLIDVRPHTLMPPLARRLAGKWPDLSNRLARMPILCSHLFGTIRQV
jgi:ubiquinone/menaquinone biosynthesis C-methylase UbiE